MPVSILAMFDELEKIAKTRLMKEVIKQYEGMGPGSWGVLEKNPRALSLLTEAQDRMAVPSKGFAGNTQIPREIPNLHRRQIAHAGSGSAEAAIMPTPTGGVGVGKLLKQNPKHTPNEDLINQNRAREAIERDRKRHPKAWRPDVSTDMGGKRLDNPGSGSGRVRLSEDARYSDELDKHDPLVQNMLARPNKRGLRDQIKELTKETKGGYYDRPLGDVPGPVRLPIAYSSLMDVKPGSGITPEHAADLAAFYKRIQAEQGVVLTDLHQGNVGYVTRQGKPRKPALFDLGHAREVGVRPDESSIGDLAESFARVQGPVGRRIEGKELIDFRRATEEAARGVQATSKAR